MPTIQDVNTRFVRELTEQLGERLNQPAHLAFKNIKIEWFKDVPAKQLLEIMDGGYAKVLGVRCTHCHVADDFASDDKRPKRAAREMAAMHWDMDGAARPDAEPDWRAGGTVHQLRHVPSGSDRPSRRTALSDGVHGGYSLGNGRFGVTVTC